jgi:hypothetical protein
MSAANTEKCLGAQSSFQLQQYWCDSGMCSALVLVKHIPQVALGQETVDGYEVICGSHCQSLHATTGAETAQLEGFRALIRPYRADSFGHVVGGGKSKSITCIVETSALCNPCIA